MIYDNENHVEEDINPPLSRIVILEKYRLPNLPFHTFLLSLNNSVRVENCWMWKIVSTYFLTFWKCYVKKKKKKDTKFLDTTFETDEKFKYNT